MPQELQLQPGFALLIVTFGSSEEHAQLVAPVRDALAPLFDLVTPIPYVQRMFDEGNEWGRHAYERLARIKAEYDPDNVFHRNANIRPAAARA